MKYLLSIDQSTQGTKALLFDEEGKPVSRAYRRHRQIIDKNGYISHDLDEIWQSVLAASGDCIGMRGADIAAIGISNQRETSCIWDREGPLAYAVVWQCLRGKEIADSLSDYTDALFQRTGLPLSPYFPAAKYAWLLQNTPHRGNFFLGTIDSYLVWKMTGNFYTDYSNASRTQLFNLDTLTWDEECCRLFGIPRGVLAQVIDSDALFGYTDLNGILPSPIPVHAVLGDSHAALYAQGCHTAGSCKITYGTGSSVMLNTGGGRICSKNRLASSLAWRVGGKTAYVLEGNVNYSCAVMTWLKEVGVLPDPAQAGEMAMRADAQDATLLIPAFSGLSAPYWRTDLSAAIMGMTRRTGKNELVRAAEESIAFQIADIVDCLREDTQLPLNDLRADGGAAADAFLMQTQANYAKAKVFASDQKELSAFGVGYLAGCAYGIYGEKAFQNIGYTVYSPRIVQEERRRRWQQCVQNL